MHDTIMFCLGLATGLVIAAPPLLRCLVAVARANGRGVGFDPV